MLSVIICTHNPREDYLHRTLEGLKGQSQPRANWELLLIDNHSDQLLSMRFDLSWHPNGRIVREEELGLTPARLRGVQESRSELLIFVDDDNVLAPDYLSLAVEISAAHPNLGTWGGQSIPEFEGIPPADCSEIVGCLAIRQFDRDEWGNGAITHPPVGAGMCVRRPVAEAYAKAMDNDPLRRRLDRKGNSLISSGDRDIVQTGLDQGTGTGAFTRLKLVHLIAARRCTGEYLHRLAVNCYASSHLMNQLRGGSSSGDPRTFKRRAWAAFVAKVETMMASPARRRLLRVEAEAKVLAEHTLREWRSEPAASNAI